VAIAEHTAGKSHGVPSPDDTAVDEESLHVGTEGEQSGTGKVMAL
jgi:hypothetical protein